MVTPTLFSAVRTLTTSWGSFGSFMAFTTIHRTPWLASALLLAGCGAFVKTPAPEPVVKTSPYPPSYSVLLPNADGTTGKVMLGGAAPGRSEAIDTAGLAAGMGGASPAFIPEPGMVERDFSAAMAARPGLPTPSTPSAERIERFVVYFDNRESQFSAANTAVIQNAIARSQQYPNGVIAVIGHTDTRGSTAANFELALERALGVARMLQDGGARASRITVASKGEKMLAVPTANNVREPKNRRVEIELHPASATAAAQAPTAATQPAVRASDGAAAAAFNDAPASPRRKRRSKRVS
jgi:outer membrane protein OmpA-like peptidoglycan-associated protein